MESEREAYFERPVSAQLEQIAAVLERITAALADTAMLEAARDDADRNMAYTE